MPYVGQKPADIISTAVDTVTGAFSGAVTVTGAAILNGGIDVAGDLTLDADGGDIILKDGGTTIGSIGTSGGATFYGGTASGIMFNGVNINPTNGTATRADNANDIGAASYRFKDLYLSGGVFLGGTGTANKLDDYEEGTWTPGFNNVSVQQGSYIKIGDMVFCSATITTSAGGASGSTISGLPFTTFNSNAARGGGLFTYQDEIQTQTFALLVEANNTSAIIRVGSTSKELSASKDGFMSFSYRVA